MSLREIEARRTIVFDHGNDLLILGLGPRPLAHLAGFEIRVAFLAFRSVVTFHVQRRGDFVPVNTQVSVSIDRGFSTLLFVGY